MQAYHFIKYNQETTTDHLIEKSKSGAVLCFDLEDSIQNPSNPSLNAALKEEYRQYFKNIYTKIMSLNLSIRIGIRINCYNSKEFDKDLKRIESLEFDSIYIPKIESGKDLHAIIQKLKDYKVQYQTIIPVIETTKGIDKLKEISNTDLHIHKKIAFGHCDYNLSSNIFPFFHQDSFEYWKWVNKIIEVLSLQNIPFINSPYLDIKNEAFFGSMLSYLSKICHGDVGQVTLSTKQSELCANPPVAENDFHRLIPNRHNLCVPENYSINLISEFESNNCEKGLTKNNERFISYQEYMAAKKHAVSNANNILKISIVGGCFPVQYNIVFEDIFHQKLKKSIENEFNTISNFQIIRYERFVDVVEKIEKSNETFKPDFLIFSIRPEPYLRLIKLLYKHIDDNGVFRWSLNLPYFNILSPEKYDMLTLGRKYKYNSRLKVSVVHKLLITFNYVLGKIIGNQKYAIDKSKELIACVSDYCYKNGIELILLGPNTRSNSYLEPRFCKDLDIAVENDNNHYIYGLESLSPDGQSLMMKNGIHVNEKYHELIANKLFHLMKDKRLITVSNIGTKKSVIMSRVH